MHWYLTKTTFFFFVYSEAELDWFLSICVSCWAIWDNCHWLPWLSLEIAYGFLSRWRCVVCVFCWWKDQMSNLVSEELLTIRLYVPLSTFNVGSEDKAAPVCKCWSKWFVLSIWTIFLEELALFNVFLFSYQM